MWLLLSPASGYVDGSDVVHVSFVSEPDILHLAKKFVYLHLFQAVLLFTDAINHSLSLRFETAGK